MSTPKFAETPNLVAFLEKPEESNRFEGIIDFLNVSSIKYTLTVNPTIYESCIQQFWATGKTKTVNEECQIQALVDKKKVIITEKSVRSDLMLEDAEGTECLPNDVIFEQLERMGSGWVPGSFHTTDVVIHIEAQLSIRDHLLVMLSLVRIATIPEWVKTKKKLLITMLSDYYCWKEYANRDENLSLIGEHDIF
ncbi:hypothetical protein Tco_0927931 [Tanacetum coccineum]